MKRLVLITIAAVLLVSAIPRLAISSTLSTNGFPKINRLCRR